MKLSIITVSYNTKKLLKQALSAVFASSLNKRNYQVFVVDNASSDGSPEMVKKDFPQVKLIKSKDNLGFAKGNNLAIAKSDSDYIMLLNSDTKVKSNALSSLIEFMDSHPKAGVASAQILYPSGEIQQSGGFLPRLSNVFAWMFLIDDLPIVKNIFWSYQITSQSFYKKTRQLGWVTGAAMIIRRQAVSDIGLLDDKIFMYGEDVDYGIRAKKKGWQVWSVAKAKVTHFQFQSSKGISENAMLGEFKGLKYIFQKHKPKWEMPLLRSFLWGGSLLRMLLFGTILRDKNKYDIYRKALKLA